MRTTRSVEERLASLYRQGKIAGSLYRSLGQEAIPVGAAAALEPGDLIGPLFRDLGALLVRGWTPQECFAQALGRATSPTFGRDGGVAMGDVGVPGTHGQPRLHARPRDANDSGPSAGAAADDPGSDRRAFLLPSSASGDRPAPKGSRGTVAGTGVLGELVSVMAGCAMGLRMKGSDRVCLTWIGDGGTSTGAFHEGMNLAAVRKLPLIVVIENNGVAFSTPTAA